MILDTIVKTYKSVSEYGNYKIEECNEDANYVLWDKKNRDFVKGENGEIYSFPTQDEAFTFIQEKEAMENDECLIR